ncbi:LysR family transcriptional regulator [Paenarthrobacter sp. CM16]|uniref:LysR family transcriptional regulator n=1 Tax=Paenarthrobacter sp. CM16 TaxID=2738447 RepID=UPI00155815B4|nr:LysR family transcriptional regulator [Paenarthrobacter sp. CM16]NQD87798.1 LysR family transcriptional regulator [Paenarthrobacter sp. CM16]
MTILQVNYFLAATAGGSLTQAADELGVAQPTVSEQIRKLEQSLGVVLFARAKQGLTLTEAGQHFLPYARRVAQEYEDAMASVTGIRDRIEGTVSFGMFNSGQHVLAGLVPAFRTMYPNIHVRVIGANSAQVADMVRSNRLEAGVVALPIEARGLTIGDALWSCEAAYFHTESDATAAPVPVANLTLRPMVLAESGWSQLDPTRRQLNDRAQKLGLSLTPDVEVETPAGALAVAATGLAGTVVSAPVAEALGYGKTLHSVSLDPPLIETFAIITRDPWSLSPGTKAMIELVEEHMSKLHDEYQPG